MILAGGRGRRLHPLTTPRAKPAVPFGGRYRLIDIVLSNFVNSGFVKIKVLTQYKSDSLNCHISRGWRLSPMLDQYVELVPAQQREGEIWYRGNADAVWQNLNLIRDEEPFDVCVFGADHIYKMDIRQMLHFHRQSQAALTVSAVPVPLAAASDFGVIEVDAQGMMIGFEEKPKDPKPMPKRPDYALASMGNYIFRADVLYEAVSQDAENDDSEHDFGKNIVAELYKNFRVAVYDFAENRLPGQHRREVGYWRDVGTLESFMAAHMDLISIHPVFDLYNPHWPIRTRSYHNPPAKFVHEAGERVGKATDSIVCSGCVISGGRIRSSILAQRVRVNSYAILDGCILFNGVNVGRHARLRNCIVDKYVDIPEGSQIGYDRKADEERFFVSESGIVVVPKGADVSSFGE